MRLFLIVFFSFHLLALQAQENRSNAFSASLDARKMDYFFGLDYHQNIQKFNVAIGIEAGIIKSGFQQRFFPGIHGQITYPLLKKERFELSPAIDLNYDFLRVMKSSNHLNIYQEYRLGYDLKWGNKVKFIHSAGIGIIAAHFYGAYSQKYLTAFDLGYSIKMGCLYEF